MRISEYETNDGMYQLKLTNTLIEPFRWGIFKTGFRLNRTTLNFEVSPLPSNRTEDWIKDHSFILSEGKTILKNFEKSAHCLKQESKE